MKQRLLPWFLSALLSLMFCPGCKKAPPRTDSAFTPTPEITHKQIQELRLQLMEALDKRELQSIHDNMFYFRNLLKSLSGQLTGEKKQEVDKILVDLEKIADAIDNSAGRGNQGATEANLQQLIDRLQELEKYFSKNGNK